MSKGRRTSEVLQFFAENVTSQQGENLFVSICDLNGERGKIKSRNLRDVINARPPKVLLNMGALIPISIKEIHFFQFLMNVKDVNL